LPSEVSIMPEKVHPISELTAAILRSGPLDDGDVRKALECLLEASTTNILATLVVVMTDDEQMNERGKTLLRVLPSFLGR